MRSIDVLSTLHYNYVLTYVSDSVLVCIMCTAAVKLRLLRVIRPVSQQSSWLLRQTQTWLHVRLSSATRHRESILTFYCAKWTSFSLNVFKAIWCIRHVRDGHGDCTEAGLFPQMCAFPWKILQTLFYQPVLYMIRYYLLEFKTRSFALSLH